MASLVFLLSIIAFILNVTTVSSFTLNGKVFTSTATSSSRLFAEAKKSDKTIIGKAELLNLLKGKTELSKKDIDVVVGALVETVKEEVLEGGNEIRIRDFGTFKQKVGAPRVGRNPRTGEELQISGRTSVSFSAATALKIKDE